MTRRFTPQKPRGAGYLTPQMPRPADQPVLVVGAGPVGCTAALLLADLGVPVTLLERHAEPHPLPRAVHLDDEAARILGRIGLAEQFLARSRSCSGLRLLDARHRVMAEFRREHAIGVHGFPQANMFHQPELEELMFARIGVHPLIAVRRGAEVVGLDDAPGPLAPAPVQVHAVLAEDGTSETFSGCLVLGCDGANSKIRDLARITMKDLGFTERWLAVDVRAATSLDAWDGVEQVCDPARAATFMQVTGNRYRWEFQLRDGEDDASLTSAQALSRLLQPWTGRSDLDGLEIIRSATYVFRAQVATRFQAGRVFLLGDAAHLTPPFIGQGLAAGLRDADNLAWKIAHVLNRQATADLLASYHTERRPHATAMVRKALMVGWAMTGGQDRPAAVRRAALAVAVRSPRIRETIASTATPRLKTGALQHAPRLQGARTSLRIGSLIPNPLVHADDIGPVRLDDVLQGRTAVLTGHEPAPDMAGLCGRHNLLLIRIRPAPQAGNSGQATDTRAGPAGDWIDVRPGPGGQAAGLHALTRHPQLSIIVRPDRIIASAATRSRLPRLPWSTPAAVPAVGTPVTGEPVPRPANETDPVI
jgi:3-(3-hydroxy-phenyl)propionate hydroxylase